MSDYSPILLELSAQRASLGRVARALRLAIAGTATGSDNHRHLSATLYYVETATNRIRWAEDRYREALAIDNEPAE